MLQQIKKGKHCSPKTLPKSCTFHLNTCQIVGDPEYPSTLGFLVAFDIIKVKIAMLAPPYAPRVPPS